tara:strand:- start:94 stop:501 length:408 start_codon:yes stop_codon:yes gene_type:complete
MQRTLLILKIILLTSYISISQTVIPTDSVICVPTEWVKKIVIDLEERDLFEEKVNILNKEIDLLSGKIILKDSIISTAKSKEEEYIENIKSLKESVNLKDDQLSLMIKQNKKSKLQRNLIGISSIVLSVLILIAR